MPGWSGRVEVVPGTGGTTFVPGDVIVRVGSDAELELAAALLGRRYVQGEPTEENPRPPRTIPGSVRVGEHVRVPDVEDVLGAVRLLRAAGLTAQPNHVFFAHGVGGETWAGYGSIGANSVSGNPVVGHPVVGHPVVGHPVVGHPVVGHPVVGHPVVGHPVVGHPVVGHYAPAGGVEAGCGCGAQDTSSPCDWNLHCCDSDPCTCTRPRGQGSVIYPNPLFARVYYSEQVAVRYELTGVRPSAALPLYVRSGTASPTNSDWGNDKIRVAVIDTGWPAAQNHLDAYGVDPAGKAKVTVDNKLQAAKDVSGGAADECDEPDSDRDHYLDPVAGHGLFIAGLVVKHAPGVSVKVLKALSTFGDGDEWTIAARIHQLVTSDCPPHIINLSLGTYAPEQPELLAEAIKCAIRNNIIVVASAGNDGTSRPSYPAAYPGVISVAALGPDGPAPFSNWGTTVRACAPGVDVASCFWTFDGETSGEAGGDRDRYEGWALWSGTSFSAPLVAAALAVELQNQVHVRGLAPDTRLAVARVIDHPRLFRLPCFGTVINPAPQVAGL